MPIKYFIQTFCLTIALLAVSGGTGFAQEKKPSIKFDLFSVEGLVYGKVIKVDAQYGKKFGKPVAAPFSFLVPTRKGVTPLYHTGKDQKNPLIKISFTTGTRETPQEQRRFIENIQFVTMTLGPGKPEVRLATVADLLTKRAWKQAVANYPQNKYLGTAKTKIGDYDAVEVVGQYIDPKNGLMFLRIVGIPNPDGKDSIFSVSNIAASFYTIKNTNQLAKTSSGIALERFKYLK